MQRFVAFYPHVSYLVSIDRLLVPEISWKSMRFKDFVNTLPENSEEQKQRR